MAAIVTLDHIKEYLSKHEVMACQSAGNGSTAPITKGIYRCRYDRAARQVDRISLGTTNAQRAFDQLVDWVSSYADMPETDPRRITVARCLQRYYANYAMGIPSAPQQLIAIRQILDSVGDKTVSELTGAEQEKLINRLRDRGQNGSTVSRVLSVLWAGLNWCRKHGDMSHTPYIRDVQKTEPEKRAATMEELATFAGTIEDEHLARFMLLALGTAARPGAILDLTRDRFDLEARRITLNPSGRVQTKKRRPIIRMAESLVPVVSSVRFGHLVVCLQRMIPIKWVADMTVCH